RSTETSIPRIFTFGGKSEEEVSPAGEPSFFEDRADELIGRTGIGRGLKNDQLSWSQACGNLSGGSDDVTHVRFPLRRQRSRNAYDQNIGFAQTIEISRRPEETGCTAVSEAIRVQVSDIIVTGLERFDLASIDIETQDDEALLCEGQRQRQADVP